MNDSERVGLGPQSMMNGLVVGFLVLLFGFTAVDKLLHVQEFIRAVDSYRMLPVPMGAVLAPFIIAAEAVIAVGLVWRPWRRMAAFQAVVLMSIFTVALLGNKLLGATSFCGCWFSVSMGQGNSHFLLNGIIVALSAMAWRTSPATEALVEPRPA